jgi:hypothetical protein
MSFKPLSEAAKKVMRHRQYFWCRHWNGFCDVPKWRLIADRLDMPIYQVVAFVCRLDELANAADQRGSVAAFNAAEFGAALGMPEEDAARIFASLEAPDVGWIAYEHVTTFYERNRDTDDDRDADRDRKRRSRARTSALKILQRLASLGRVAPAQRVAIEVKLALPPRIFPDAELFDLVARVRQAELSTGHIGHIVTEERPERPVSAEQGRIASGVGHNVTHSDFVTVLEDQTRKVSPGSVDNSGDTARGEKKGPPDEELAGAGDDPQAEARLWIETEGVRLVVERGKEPKPRAEMLCARWRDQDCEGDAVALKEIMVGADKSGYFGVRFLNLIVDGIKRRPLKTAPELPLRSLTNVTKRNTG